MVPSADLMGLSSESVLAAGETGPFLPSLQPLRVRWWALVAAASFLLPPAHPRPPFSASLPHIRSLGPTGISRGRLVRPQGLGLCAVLSSCDHYPPCGLGFHLIHSGNQGWQAALKRDITAAVKGPVLALRDGGVSSLRDSQVGPSALLGGLC